jgi:hypothetical protein
VRTLPDAFMRRIVWCQREGGVKMAQPNSKYIHREISR